MTDINTEEQKHLFKDWLKNNRNISQSTLTSYTEDILSKLKEIITLSNNEKVKSLNHNIYSYQTKTGFDYFVKTIKSDPNFDIINKTGQASGGWVSTPLKHYGKFLADNHKTNECFNKDEISNISFPLNQILYGPPGTGKTYNTVLKAMSIIDNTKYKDVSDEKYSELKTRFDEYKQAGQIEFVTFHQSYSYEEFVEGIKPYIPQSMWGNIDEKSLPDIKYVGKKGIFREICDRANKATKKEIPFNELWNIFKSTYKDGDKIKGLRSEQVIHYINNGESLQYQTNTPSSPSLPKYKIEEYYKKHKIKPIKSSTDLFDVANKLGQGKGENGVQPLLLAVIHALEQIETEQKKISISKEPYILIIDEINRGDVSKIFGELITLIEEDKRIGNKYQMKITLPYSKETFGVPNNLYIIGTMNTADRSIALLDTALRRRFDFEEIMPRPELLNGKVVEGINLQTLLTRINERITNKYDRDHQIGHSYLINVNTKEQLERAYKNKILPLLNEYFYNETEVVAEVLNCSKTELNEFDFITILTKAQNDNKK